MKIGVPKEIIVGERRVALVPKEVAKLVDAGFEVQIESGAGAGSFMSDGDYKEAGASIVDAARAAYDADVVFKVRKPESTEVGLLKAGSMLVGFLEPLTSPELMKQLAEAKVTAVAP